MPALYSSRKYRQGYHSLFFLLPSVLSLVKAFKLVPISGKLNNYKQEFGLRITASKQSLKQGSAIFSLQAKSDSLPAFVLCKLRMHFRILNS
jgi:hypothetical protein